MSEELRRIAFAARRAARTGETGDGVRRLKGGLSHDVFEADASDGPVVVKVFRSFERGEHDREWEGLTTLLGTGIAPEPLYFDVDAAAPAVVMSRVDGTAVQVGALTPDHMDRIAAVHRVIRSVPPRSTRLAQAHPSIALKRTRDMFEGWDDDAPHVVAAQAVRHAGQAAKAWLAGPDVTALAERAATVFGRGDPNISNYLWCSDALRVIDLEDSGVSDPVCDLADMAEHLSMRPVDEPLWTHLAEASDFDRGELSRLVDARRLEACFWLVILERRTKRGEPPVQVDLPEQAERVLSLLD